MLHTEVRVKGRIEQRWLDWFADLAISTPSSDETVLVGDLPDQAALYGLLARLRDLQFELRSVTCCEKITDSQESLVWPFWRPSI
jgi:hypothetical protein